VQRELQQRGSIFSSTSDTETILHLIAVSEKTRIVPKFIDALSRMEGAYSLVGLSEKKMIGARDPLGIRPLVLGDLDGAYILASETCALDIIGARYVRDVQPGEVVVITDKGIESHFPFEKQSRRFCIFEYVYFARPDSTIENRNVYEPARRSARNWPRKCPVDADVVVPVPDSGTPAAIGFAQAGQFALRTRHHPQPLCRPHLHQPTDPRSATWASSSSTTPTEHDRGQARGPGR
jgi:amidophosphoribosyltransferase